LDQPNIVIIMTDQQRADLTAREGYAVDTTPFLDSLASSGTWFNRAYTCSPVCAPARISMFTGRFPSATRVRTNHNIPDAVYSKDMIDVLKEAGYKVALSGKNHTHIRRERFDYVYGCHHRGASVDDVTADEANMDTFLRGLTLGTSTQATPHAVETQCCARAVSRACDWIDSLGRDDKFFLWLSFPEPHNPYQVPEPYWSMFPPESLPPVRADATALETKGFKFTWMYDLQKKANPDHDEMLNRSRANYHGMLRLIDDQTKRFVQYLEDSGVRDNTLLVYISDHGDFVGEYGFMRKGLEVAEVLMRIPLIFHGPGIISNTDAHPAHVSNVDIFPTLCEALGVNAPAGVQGRSLWPLLTGKAYPAAEFDSVYGEQGFGGLHYSETETLDPAVEGALPETGPLGFDELNSWTQSGSMRMLRKGDWEIAMDMQGHGQLFNLAEDPVELNNLFDDPGLDALKVELLTDLAAWTIRSEDPLPYPRRRYRVKRHRRNWYAT